MTGDIPHLERIPERDGVFLKEDGTLDEVCGRSVHLERMDANRWFLSVTHADGTETAIWFGSRDLRRPFMETRPPRRGDIPHVETLPTVLERK